MKPFENRTEDRNQSKSKIYLIIRNYHAEREQAEQMWRDVEDLENAGTIFSFQKILPIEDLSNASYKWGSTSDAYYATYLNEVHKYGVKFQINGSSMLRVIQELAYRYPDLIFLLIGVPNVFDNGTMPYLREFRGTNNRLAYTGRGRGIDVFLLYRLAWEDELPYAIGYDLRSEKLWFLDEPKDFNAIHLEQQLIYYPVPFRNILEFKFLVKPQDGEDPNVTYVL